MRHGPFLFKWRHYSPDVILIADVMVKLLRALTQFLRHNQNWFFLVPS